MNPIKRILLIDDEPQDNSLEKIANGDKDKLTIKCKQIEVLNHIFLDKEANLNQQEVYQAIDNAFKRAHYDVVLVDYNYGLPSFDGLNVIRHIREIHQKNDIILYSAVQRDIIRQVMGDDLQTALTDDIVTRINELMNLKITKIVSRPAMDSEVIRHLKTDTTFSSCGFITNMLRENPKKVFKSCYPKLAGREYEEIADLLDNGNNGTANEWLSAILEQLIVYLSEVNE